MTALNPRTLISQYGHTAWKSSEGLLSHPEAVTQTTDGYIWSTTLIGVFRFDGVKFTEWTPNALGKTGFTINRYESAGRLSLIAGQERTKSQSRSNP